MRKLTIIGSDNGLSPGRRQAIIWTNAGILLIRTLGTNFSEILSEIHTFSFKKIQLKMSLGKRRPFCLGLNVLMFATTFESTNLTNNKYTLELYSIVQIWHIGQVCSLSNLTVYNQSKYQLLNNYPNTIHYFLYKKHSDTTNH